MSDLDVPAVETAIQLRQETPQSDRNPSEASLPQFNLQPHPRKGTFVDMKKSHDISLSKMYFMYITISEKKAYSLV